MIRPPYSLPEVLLVSALTTALGYGAGWAVEMLAGAPHAAHYAGLACACWIGVMSLTITCTIYQWQALEWTKMRSEQARAGIKADAPRRLELVTGNVVTVARLDVTDAQLDALRRGLAVDRSLSSRRWVGKGKPFREYEAWRGVVDELVKRGWAARVGQSWAINDVGMRGLTPPPPGVNG